jgi:phytoene synthase
MPLDPLERYSDAASRSAGVVISRYSTSFGMACRLLGASARRDVENIYALVRVADEAVDGAAAAAGLDAAAVGEQLDRLERETESAMASGYSTNMVVHAFARTARGRGIGTDLTRPFFASMRADLSVTAHSDASLQEYIYGSAEVVGLMCLRVFQTMPGAVRGHDAEMAAAARRLGAAFQKVNFLRDLAADGLELGRSYFPGADPSRFDDATKTLLIADIREDLAAAREGIRLLAPGARRAVSLAHGLFEALVDRLERVPAEQLLTRRVRVAAPEKAAIALRVLVRGPGHAEGAA